MKKINITRLFVSLIGLISVLLTSCITVPLPREDKLKPYLGTVLMTLDSSIATKLGLSDKSGVLIAAVSPGSPADKAGLYRYDVVRKFNGFDTHQASDLYQLIMGTKPAQKCSMEVMRQGKSLEVPVYIESQPSVSDWRMFGPDTVIHTEISSLAAPDISTKGKFYYIKSAMKDVGDNDLEFQEVARYVQNALFSKGYLRTEDIQKADILLRLGYGIGSMQSNTENVVIAHGYSYPVGWMWFTAPPTTQTIQRAMYMRNLILEAYDLSEPGTNKQLWKTTVKSEGSSSDFLRVLAYMVAVSSRFYTENIGIQVNAGIKGDEPLVLDILKVWK